MKGGFALGPPLPPGEGRGEGKWCRDRIRMAESPPGSPHPNPLPEGEGPLIARTEREFKPSQKPRAANALPHPDASGRPSGVRLRAAAGGLDRIRRRPLDLARAEAGPCRRHPRLRPLAADCGGRDRLGPAGHLPAARRPAHPRLRGDDPPGRDRGHGVGRLAGATGRRRSGGHFFPRLLDDPPRHRRRTRVLRHRVLVQAVLAGLCRKGTGGPAPGGGQCDQGRAGDLRRIFRRRARHDRLLRQVPRAASGHRRPGRAPA